VRTADLVELLFEVVQADDWTGAAGQFGSDAAERDDVFRPCFVHGGGDGVAHAIRVSERIFAGEVGWNHDVGRIGPVKGFGKSAGIGDVSGEGFGTFRREWLKMSRVSANDANFLAASQKVAGHNVSGIAACSHNYMHNT